MITSPIPVTIYGPNLPRELSQLGTLVAHRTGCADTTKFVYRRLGADQGAWNIEASTIEDIIDAIYGDFEDYPENPQNDPEDAYGAYRNDVHVFPCVDLPEHARLPVVHVRGGVAEPEIPGSVIIIDHDNEEDQ